MYVDGKWIDRVLLTKEEKKERKRESNKKYYSKHRDSSRAKAKEVYTRCLKDPDKLKRLREQRNAWYHRNKVRLKLHRQAIAAVQYAIQKGTLIRPDTCEKCGKTNPEGHHSNGYEKEHWLDVEWLCKDCHGEATRK